MAFCACSILHNVCRVKGFRSMVDCYIASGMRLVSYASTQVRVIMVQVIIPLTCDVQYPAGANFSITKTIITAIPLHPDKATY